MQEDKNAKIENIIREESFKRQFSSNLDEKEIEAAVIERLQAEEESAEIQEMIAKFYNKFDELHEQSVGQALARSPNKQQVKMEVKYKIPERWTKKFHKLDIVPLSFYQQSAVNDERGRVNKQTIADNKQQYIEEQNKNVMDNLQQQVPLSNSVLKESLSSRATPKSEYIKGRKIKL